MHERSAVSPGAVDKDELSRANRAGQRRAERQALQNSLHVRVKGVNAKNVTADWDLEEASVPLHFLVLSFGHDALRGQRHELLLAGEADARFAAQPSAAVRAAEKLLAAGFLAGLARLAAERPALLVLALPGAGLPAGSARDSARAGTMPVPARLPTARFARQAFGAARQRAAVAAGFSSFAALALARDVHAPAPALAARARTFVAAVQLDLTWMTTGQHARSYVAGRFYQVTARPDFLHLQ